MEISDTTTSALPALSAGREFLTIPGPSVIPDRVLAAMHRPAPNIYEGELVELTSTVHDDLRAVAGTSHHSIIYIGNGHAAWEAALANTLAAGDRILVLSTGLFAGRWADMARPLGVDVESLEFGYRSPVDPARVRDHLAADADHRIAAVLMVQVDTASSVANDVAAVAEAARSVGHPALVMVDAIASFGSVPMRMDEWDVDVVVAACQKGLMTPPGLSFNFVGPRAWAARERVGLASSHWDWVARAEPEAFYMQFNGTPPTHHLFGLRTALDLLVHEEGLAAAAARHHALAGAVRACVATWAEDGPFELNVTDPDARSDVVTTVLTPGIDADALRADVQSRSGVVLGVGIGALDAPSFRIGHMGHLNPPMILGSLAATELSLRALGIPHRSGLEAALAALTP